MRPAPILVIVLLILSPLARVVDNECPQYGSPGAIAFAIPDESTKSPFRSNYKWDAIWLTNIVYNGQERFVSIKRRKIESISDEFVYPNDPLNNDLAEFQLLGCVKKAPHMYIVKSVFRRSDICPDGDQVGDTRVPTSAANMFFYNQKREIWGNFKLVPNYFDSLKTLGEGGFGKVKEIIVGGEKLALKKGTSVGVPVGELVLSQKFGESRYGVIFRGCFTLGSGKDQMQYMALGKLTYKTDSGEFITMFRASPKQYRLGFYAKLFLMIYDFEQLNYTHNDIKPDNIMVDDNLEPHLLDYGCARPIDGFDGGCGTRLYSSKLRMQQLRSKPYHDVFSMAVTILAFEHPYGQNYLLQKVDNPKEILDMTTWPPTDDPQQTFEAHWAAKVNGALTATWGPYDPNETNYYKMNLTTLIMRILVSNEVFTAKRVADIIIRMVFPDINGPIPIKKMAVNMI